MDKVSLIPRDREARADISFRSQIIFDRSGLIPNVYRAPYGDVDERVRAIAREVFGMRCALWNAVKFLSPF